MTSLVVQSRTGGSLIVNTPGIPGPAGPPGADGVGIPAISEGDASKVLAVKSDESGSEWVDALALKADADAVINALESAVDENIPIFDGITGDKLKDSGVKLSDKADLTYVEYLMMEGDPA